MIFLFTLISFPFHSMHYAQLLPLLLFVIITMRRIYSVVICLLHNGMLFSNGKFIGSQIHLFPFPTYSLCVTLKISVAVIPPPWTKFPLRWLQRQPQYFSVKPFVISFPSFVFLFYGFLHNPQFSPQEISLFP